MKNTDYRNEKYGLMSYVFAFSFMHYSIGICVSLLYIPRENLFVDYRG